FGVPPQAATGCAAAFAASAALAAFVAASFARKAGQSLRPWPCEKGGRTGCPHSKHLGGWGHSLSGNGGGGGTHHLTGAVLSASRRAGSGLGQPHATQIVGSLQSLRRWPSRRPAYTPHTQPHQLRQYRPYEWLE
ncbi:hypothetical protein FB451DRAFT_1291795, partial [Mycena latifolia]